MLAAICGRFARLQRELDAVAGLRGGDVRAGMPRRASEQLNRPIALMSDPHAAD